MFTLSRRQTTSDDDQMATALLARAASLLLVDQSASLDEFADAAGVSQRWTRKRFGTRERVVAELAASATAQVINSWTLSRQAGGSADVVWARSIARAWDLAPSFAFLLRLRQHTQYVTVEELRAPLVWRKTETLRQGVSTGVFRTHSDEESRADHELTVLMDELAFATEPSRQAVDPIMRRSLDSLGVPDHRTELIIRTLRPV